jgi:hypothetical protein
MPYVSAYHGYTKMENALNKSGKEMMRFLALRVATEKLAGKPGQDAIKMQG